MEKAAKGIWKLAFVWATMTMLGEFASDTHYRNFWVMTLVMLAESSRIFSRSRELEWQQLFSKSKANQSPNCESADGASESEGARVTSSMHMITVPLLPCGGRVLTPFVVGQILYFAQLASAMICIGVSLWRIIQLHIFEREIYFYQRRKTLVSVTIFYVLTILEAGLFLLERCYWEYMIRFKKLLDGYPLRDETGLGKAELGQAELSADEVKQFFHDAYFICLKGGVFDVLNMDLERYSKQGSGKKSSGKQNPGNQSSQQIW